MKNKILLFLSLALFISANVTSATTPANNALEEEFFYCQVTHISYLDGRYVSTQVFNMPNGHPDCGGVVIHWRSSNNQQ